VKEENFQLIQMEDEIAELKQIVTALTMEIKVLKVQNAKLETSQKLIRAETQRVKTMSDKYLPTIGDLMGQNGRKGA